MVLPEQLIKQLLSERINPKQVFHNPSPSLLYELALNEDYEGKECAISSTGALISYSGEKTGRSPLDKRIVDEIEHHDDIWWGDINIPLSESSFQRNLDMAIGFLNGRNNLYVIDAFAGWELSERIKVRIICARPYHALFMHNMLIRPTQEELQNFGEPEWVIYNAGQCPADPRVEGVTSETSVDVNFKTKQFVILGSEYAGCMKKGVFTILNYTLPQKGILSMHCAANEGKAGDTCLFFGLSGTGKTTLATDPERQLIGDDEHGWSDTGIFNFEGGCYAKTIRLNPQYEPQIAQAIKFGSVLENVVYDPITHIVDFDDDSITENTRVSYPIEFIEEAKIPCVGGHPKNVVFLTCDAYGVLPPISKLSPEQAMYHFISGYTAKVAGTEMGIKEPKATFSACFGAAFMVWHPMKYAELLKEKLLKHNANVWLLNTGWTGGSYGVGERLSLPDTRSLLKAALKGDLDNVTYTQDPYFGLNYPNQCPRVSEQILNPKTTWSDKNAYDETAKKLVQLFKNNFVQFEKSVSAEVLAVAPKIPTGACNLIELA